MQMLLLKEKNQEMKIPQIFLTGKITGNLPHFQHHADLVKIPAAWLIEQCGLKGKRAGAVGTHTQQALVIVNHDNACGKTIHQFARHIQQAVLEKFSISLENEVNYIPSAHSQ